MENLEFDKICRLCLSDKGKMKSLFDSFLDKMLLSFAQIQAERNDGLPELVCFQCVLQVSRTFRFKNQCEKSNGILREHIKKIVPNELKSKTETKGNIENHTKLLNDEIGEQTFETILTQKCDDCTTDGNSKSDFVKTTKLEQIENVQFECKICKKIFKKRKILQRHLKIHDSNKPYQCFDCNKTFAESSNLNQHMKTHTGELRNLQGKPNLCSICGKSFKWPSSLFKHMKYHTKNKIYNCSQCPKFYVERKSLDIHVRTHTGEKPFKCNVCDKSFTQSCNLSKHLRIHSGEKPFECKICYKKFSQSGYIKIHMRSHTGEKPYQCPECGKCFAGSNTLTLHKKIHTNERPFVCEIDDCRKSFNRLESALIHKRKHNDGKIHKCRMCLKEFSSINQLAQHRNGCNLSSEEIICEEISENLNEIFDTIDNKNQDNPTIFLFDAETIV